MAALLVVAIAACGPLAPGATQPRLPSASPRATASPTDGLLPTVPPAGGNVAPGTYWWTGFSPTLQLTIAETGWRVGHRHDLYFDLFRGEAFPAIGFGRFSHAYSGAATTVAASEPDDVIAALQSNAAVSVTDIGPASVAGLLGRTVDIRVSAPQTHRFRGDGDFNGDPEFVTRYHLLGLPGGGVLFIAVTAPEGALDEGNALAAPIIAALRLREGAG